MRAALLVLLLGAETARADEPRWMSPPLESAATVASGRRAELRLAGGERELEAGLARDGAYARGIRLDAAGDHSGALKAYGEALAEVNGLAELSSTPSCAILRRAKVAWQRQESEKLLEQKAYASVMPASPMAHLNLASTYHRKFLSVRAFLGQAPEALWRTARDEYLEALTLDGHYAAARVGLAALLAEAGLVDEARAEFAQLGRRKDDDSLAMAVAAYQAATGDRAGALETLRDAVKQVDNRRWALVSNDFDALRGDPRFEALFALSGDELPVAFCRHQATGVYSRHGQGRQGRRSQ